MKDFNFKNLVSTILILSLIILAIFILKPIILSVVFGFLLAYIFYPLYKKVQKVVKNKNIAALIICVGLLILMLGGLALILGVLLRQIVNFYISLQKVDFVAIVKSNLPAFIASSEASTLITSSINTYLSNFIADFLKRIGDFILELPVILLQLFVVAFVFFYLLKDGDKAVDYFKSLSFFKKETEEKFLKQFKDVTYSVLVGQVIVGIIQGLVSGIGYFIFKVPNTLLLTFLTIIIGIIPLIGPWLVWVPVDIYLFSVGKTGAGLGLLIYGLIVISWIDALIRPLIVSKHAQINPVIAIIGMIGGLFTFGILGLIIGPLVLAYLLLILELYRKGGSKENILFKREE